MPPGLGHTGRKQHTMRHQRSRRLTATLAAAAGSVLAVGAFVAGTAGSQALASSSSSGPVHVSGKPIFTTNGGATPLPTDRTVPHWSGSFTDPTNGVTYGYNMVGNGDPRTYQGTTTVPTEIIPMNFTFSDGQQFNGSDATQAMVNSPIWQSTSWASARVTPTGKAQPLSNAGTTQYEDAVMRSQFNDVGSSTFHLLLGQPTILPTVTISVPANQGVVASFGSGFSSFGDVDITWFSAQMNNLINSLHIDPATLPIFVTNNVYLYTGHNYTNCCVLGFHGAAHVTGKGLGGTNGNGKQGVQTFAYAAYAQPGTWSTSATPASPDGSDGYYIQDIHAISHEISEWADDPFTNNTVDPWLTPTAPQYGCSTLLETGDPVVGIGVLIGKNPYFQTAGANADGYWHPEDEVFLPWFARQAPNTTSEKLQNAATGRYTFFGDLNPYPGFQQPATGC
jgi:hypothetical protein